MENVRLLIQEEGRTARNLVAFNVPLGVNTSDRVTRKPPSVPRISSSASLKRNIKNSARVRSASTGRDKKSELQARYWAFLFGNLQRAVDGIYQTCEEDENISECKEVIMVLENYTRDFHNLIEWFKVKWAYETSPPPLRTAPLAWEVRKTSPCRLWNSSSITSKCPSPNQRLSPTFCKSPEGQRHECKKYLNDIIDYKKLNDYKNNITKKDPKKKISLYKKETGRLSICERTILSKVPVKLSSKPSISLNRKLSSDSITTKDGKNTSINKENKQIINSSAGNLNQSEKEKISQNKNQIKNTSKNGLSSNRKCYSLTVSSRSAEQETPRIYRSKTTLTPREITSVNKVRPGSSVMMRRRVVELKTENEIRGSVEVLSKQSDVKSRRQSVDSDGWQTVRSRNRRGSSHSLNMSTRFHRPTTATSLPALSIDTKVENNIPKINDSNLIDKNCDNNVEDNIVELKNVNLSQNINCETNSTSMIAAVFKSEADLLEKRIQQFMSAQAERERIILEEERKTEEADSKRSKQLSDEEEFLQKQIQELESTEIDIDTETDETDGEMVLEIEDDNEAINNENGVINVVDDISLEDRYENMLEGMSWTERMDTLAQLQALVARHPGRALELHQKLSSPSRKRSLPETLRRYQAKQACAQRKRQKLLSEKSQRLRELLNKVEDVKKAKKQLTEDKRLRMEMKLKRAEENRTQHLLEVVRKAHDEESKLKEIAFINELEAQHKKHDFILLCQEQEERLQGIQEERQRRQEEKAAKEAAAEERRRAIEADRQLRIQKMRQARQEREERVGKMQLEREKERQELAREKARDREERLSALHAAQLANQEELQKKIAQKQQESARRHVENIEHIRQRAVELSILRIEEIPPTLKFYIAPKQCSLCSIQIPNEVCLLSHLKGKIHFEGIKKMHDGKEPSRDELQRFNIAQIRDMQIGGDRAEDKVAKEKQKALKRRCRKLKQRLTAKGQEWESPRGGDKIENYESTNKAKFRRNLKELDRLCSCHGKTPWSSVAVSGLERCLGEIGRAFSKAGVMDQDAFRSLNGFETLTNLLNLGVNIQNNSHNLPNKSIVTICRVYRAAVADHSDNIESILLSIKILVILDLLLQRFEIVAGLEYQAQAVETTGNSHAGNGSGSVTTAVIQLLCSLVPEVPSTKTSIQNRIHDIIGFLVTGGLIDRITRHNRALIETDFFHDHEHESQILLASYDLLSRFCCNLKKINGDSGGGGTVVNNDNEQTMMESHLLGCLQMTEAAGTIGCLYSMFALTQQKSSSPTPGQNSCSSFTKIFAFKALRLLRNIGQVDLQVLQNLLGNEGTNLQWRLIANHMMTRFLREPIGDLNDSTLSTHNSVTILLELISVLGYFAVNNIENQLILQTAETGPSVLQHLCTLPFPFYGDPKLAPFTLPTLLAATHENSEAISILSCEMSYQLLEEYKNSEEGKIHPLIRLLKDT